MDYGIIFLDGLTIWGGTKMTEADQRVKDYLYTHPNLHAPLVHRQMDHEMLKEMSYREFQEVEAREFKKVKRLIVERNNLLPTYNKRSRKIKAQAKAKREKNPHANINKQKRELKELYHNYSKRKLFLDNLYKKVRYNIMLLEEHATIKFLKHVRSFGFYKGG